LLQRHVHVSKLPTLGPAAAPMSIAISFSSAQRAQRYAWAFPRKLAHPTVVVGGHRGFCAASAEPPPDSTVTFEDVSLAAFRIRGKVRMTECVKSHALSYMTGTELYLKKDLNQFTGSFKERGACNALLALSEEERRAGVCAASAGNHALALTWHAKQLGVPVTVAMPTIAPLTKVSRCRSFEAEVLSHGAHIGEAKEYVLQERVGMKYINGYDDAPIIAGAGTMAIEILEQVPDVDVLVVPVGGGGLIAGAAVAVKAMKPSVQVIGIEPEFCASLTAALAAGTPVAPEIVQSTLADGLAVPVVGSRAFRLCQAYVDECLQVSELLIALAVLRLVETEKTISEGGGAAGVAALLPGGPLDRPSIKGKKVVVPLCGGNIDTPVLGRVMDRGLAADGRLVRFVVEISDRPGGISGLSALLEQVGASIRDIQHERAWLHTSVDKVHVKCVVETMGEDHNKQIKEALQAKYPLAWGTEASATSALI